MAARVFSRENGVSEAHLKWWERELEGVSTSLELATDHVRTSGPARSAHFDIKIETALGSAVARAAKQMEVTNFSSNVYIWIAYGYPRTLYRSSRVYTHQWAQAHGTFPMVGMFVSSIPSASTFKTILSFRRCALGSSGSRRVAGPPGLSVRSTC